MTILEIHLEVEDTVVVADSPGAGNIVRGLDFVPGSSVRGALAARYLARHGTADDRFRRLFDGDLRFLDAAVVHDGQRCLAAPRSSLVCKHFGRSHGVVDTGHRSALAMAEERAATQSWSKCPQCGDPLKADQGWVSPDGSAVAVPMVAETRTELVDGLARDGALFSMTGIAPGTTLAARVHGPQAAVDELGDTTGLAEGVSWRVGRGRSVHGSLRVRELSQLPEPRPGRLLDEWEGYLFVVLRSRAIFVDRFLRPSWAPEAPDGYSLSGWSNLAVTRVAGWNAGQGLPKPVDWAVTAGSAFLFKPNYSAYGDRSRLPPFEADGVGLRRAEGFGEVAVCPPPDEGGPR